ncbi:MAG: metal ABC transporter permease, partial [Thermomicrobiales bacterium]
GRLNNDTAIGVLFAGGFALGVAILSTQRSYTRDLNSFLFGSILSVTRQDLYLTAGIGVIVLATIYWFRRELTTIAFDRTFARASGLRLWAFDQLFLVLLALAIVVSLQTVGNILVLAMLVTPAATARLLTDRLVRMMLGASVIGSIAGLAGLYVSYYEGVPSGSAVVLVETLVFGLVFLFNPRSGVITSRILRKMHLAHPERDSFPEPQTPSGV